MFNNIGILHLSDIHASSKSKGKISDLVELLNQDLAEIQLQYNTKIHIVCISGDLINSGDNSEVELDIVYENLICPLTNVLQLDENRVFIVAGNHEVQKSKIVQYIEHGLETTLLSESDIELFFSQKDTEALKRINYFNDFSSLFGGTPIIDSELMRSYLFSIDNTNIGIVCINSAWRSTGIGSTEKGKMIIGRKQIIDGFKSIQTADIKICMMHHPLDWLIDVDKTSIEKCINQFDIILNGHIHENDTKVYTSYNGQSIFNTCGKFDNSSDIYNGYSVISINPYNKECNIILRQYFDFPRNCYDKAIGQQSNGLFTSFLGKKDDTLALAYDVTHSIGSNFLAYANSYFVSNVASGKILKSFDESFIPPVFSRYSEYEKETSFDENDDEKELTLEQICNEQKNILLLGKKEIGKTTILHYIAKHCISNFNVLHSVPIIIDCSHIDYTGKDVVIRAALRYISDFCSENASFSQNNVRTLFEAGLCTVLFDNFEIVNENQLLKINDFLSTYPKNKFIFSETESIGARSLRAAPVVPTCTYEAAHICSLTKGQIRSIAKQCVLQGSQDETCSVVDKVMLCFKKTTLPKTPFVLSLILSLCDSSDFSPINEAVVMEQFMESLLEKASPSEADSRNFDFRTKEDFLIYIVSFMNKQNRYYLNYQEFDNIVNEYHSDIGFSVNETRFDKLFFEKGVLVKTPSLITFRYTCMVEYYIAKKAGQEPDFLARIMAGKNYLNYSRELIYFTGLNRRSHNILEAIQTDLQSYYDVLCPLVNDLSDYHIGLEISLPENALKQHLNETRYTQEKSDKLSDSVDSSETLLPENIDKQVTHDDMNSFIETLMIYGCCLKNLELISRTEKAHAFDCYLSGLCITLAIFKKHTEEFFDDMISEMEQNPEKYDAQQVTRAKNTLIDILKIALPLSIQNIALENIGTTKLRSIFDDAIKNSSLGNFKKFFSVFMFADLRLPGLQKVLQSYASEAQDKSLLKIIFFKLLYYYQFRYFSSSLDSFLENTLADINIKLNNGSKYAKSSIVNKIKSTRALPS